MYNRYYGNGLTRSARALRYSVPKSSWTTASSDFRQQRVEIRDWWAFLLRVWTSPCQELPETHHQ